MLEIINAKIYFAFSCCCCLVFNFSLKISHSLFYKTEILKLSNIEKFTSTNFCCFGRGIIASCKVFILKSLEFGLHFNHICVCICVCVCVYNLHKYMLPNFISCKFRCNTFVSFLLRKLELHQACCSVGVNIALTMEFLNEGFLSKFHM